MSEIFRTGSEDECGMSHLLDVDPPPCQDCDKPTNNTDEDGQPLCLVCEEARDESLANDVRDEAYERAARRARANDFEDTDGKDWT